MNIAEHLRRAVATSPSKAAIVECGWNTPREFSYRDLYAASSRVASVLKSRGLQPGDRAAVFLERSLDGAAALFGVWMAGGIAVPVYESFRGRHLAHILKHSGSTFLVTNGPRARIA